MSRPNRKALHQEWREELSFAQQQRFKFFETKLLWEGRVNRQDLCQQFQLSANHLTRDIREYKQVLPKNIWYDEVARAYRPTSKFKPEFISGSTNEYLAYLRHYTFSPSSTAVMEIGSPIACDSLPFPQSNITSNVLRKLLRAIHQSIGCKVVYQSFSNPKPKTRQIWPHAMAWIGDRWHIRTFDKSRNDYIDLVLARVESVELVGIQPPEGTVNDVLWHEQETFNLIPHATLSASQKRAVAKEFGMTAARNGYYWQITLRKCLIPYFLERHHLNESMAPHFVKRLSLEDPEISKKYSFPTE